jgi:hypothetical protein
MTRKLEWIGVVVLALGASCAPTEFAPGAKVEIEAEVMVDPVESGLERSMLGMVTHPDGSIYLNTQTQQRLYKSTDQGRSWTRLPVNLPQAPPDQVQHGLFVSRDGRLWLMHQSPGGKDLFVSVSSDSGSTWKTTSIDFGQFSPGGSEDPYVLCANDYNTFFQEADGTVVLGVGLRYADHRDYQQEDRSRSGFHETLIRSRDEGASWGDPTEVHQHVAETGYAVDPNDSMRVLAMTRIQRPPFPGEDVAAMSKRSGAPPGASAIYKQGILLESSDGGRTFQEVPGSLNEYYGHRGTILWTPGNVVVITHQGGVPGKSAPDGTLLARISLDGGRTWLDGTESGTSSMADSTRFLLVPRPPGHSYTAPTVELEPDHFLTVYNTQHPGWESRAVKGVFWRLVRSSAN